MTASADPSTGSVQLSVVIACLNAAETIGEQLQALAAQSCPVPWELLICDNGSTDATARIVERFRDRLPLTWVDASAHRGPGAARNTGAAVARGQWLAFCDADDVVAHDWLARMCAALERFAFVAGRFDGTLLNDERTLRSRSLDQTDGLQQAADGSGMPHAGAGNMGLHLELFRRVGGFDLSMTCLEDTDLSWRVQQLGVVLHYVPDVVVHVRLRSSLADMYRQARGYGRAHAVLECRFGDCDSSSDELVMRMVASTGGRGIVALARAWFGRRPSVGRFVWQLGWHRGYHEAVKDRTGLITLSSQGPGRIGPVAAGSDDDLPMVK
jgi:glycosyltransferase involved in cell wall biosynthesis